MACPSWIDKLDTYLDGELPREQEHSVREHLRNCSLCAADSLERLQTKRAVQNAGLRFTPSPAFRARIEKSLAPAPSIWARWPWLSAALAVAASLLIAGVLWTQHARGTQDQKLVSQLLDMHVATLASANPVDVISTDRHTVKPWFAGKLPFTFNLPELQGSPFTLVGGRMSFLNQSAGAELIYKVRQHQISAFIFQSRAVEADCDKQSDAGALEFHIRSWSKNGLCYFVMGDASAADIENLAALLKSAA
jgi:anti-sigma factor RsiW